MSVDETMVRRFFEASRRAEIIALVNSVASEAELGELVTAKLCEAFEAEMAFILAVPGDRSPPVLAGSTGLRGAGHEAVIHHPLCRRALDGNEPVTECGEKLLGEGGRALVLVPVHDGNEHVLLGVMRLYDQPFDEPEVALLEGVGPAVLHGLQRAWLSDERELNATRQAALARAAKALGESLEPARVLSTLCEEVSHATGADVVVVYFGDEATELVVVAAYGIPESFIGLRRARGEGLSGRVLATGAAQVSNTYQEDRFGPESTAELRHARSAASVPLRRRGAIDGALSIGFTDGRWVGPADVELLTAFADLASIAVRNAHDLADAQRAASHDSLTGCLNHGAFQVRLRQELARAERGAEPFTLVLLDLENFKAVNERHGHLSGDTVLRSVGERLRAAVRTQDVVARFGGDEFALILPETEEGAAEPLLQRLLDSLAITPVPGGVGVRAHAGIAEWRPGEQPTALIERVDSALRAGKLSRVRDDVAPAQPDHDEGAALTHERLASTRRKRLAVAARVGAKLSRLLDQQSIAHVTTRELTATLGYEFAAMLRLSREGLVSTEGASGDVAGPAGRRPPPAQTDDGPVGRCLRERRPVLALEELSSGSAVRSELAVPVHAGSHLWGALDLRSSELNAFDEDDARLVELVADHAGAALRTAQLYRQLERTHMGVAEALAAALEAKDGYTAGHARWIADLAVEIGARLGLGEDVLRDLRYGAIFHDIGKIAVPDAILNKPGPLSDEEFEIVKRHPVIGEQILSPVPFLSEVRRIVRHDHERWDGAGYPDGLRGSEIPIGARIVFAADAYHAMTSDRPYRRAMSDERAREVLREGAGQQFDPDVVRALEDLLAGRS